jgi:Domain of Unknown Function (DUF349)
MSQEFYSIEDNQVVLHATKWFDKRVLTTIDEKNKEATLGFLNDKFAEVDKETMMIKADYINSTEKLKLAGKINRHRSYLSTVKAIGDFSKLFTELDDMEGEIKKMVDQNIAHRLEMVAKVEAIIASEGDWKSNTEKIADIAKEMKALPLVPDPRVEELKNKFDQLRDDFFGKKKGHYEGQEQILMDNLAHKIELCEQAERLAVSTDWKKTTEEINAINEKWKTIGHIPRHRSDELWLRFNTAKDIFFAKKRENYESIKVDQEGALKIKLELIEKANALKDSRDWKKTSDAYEQLLKEWKESGRVSGEMNEEVWAKFNEPRNFFYDAKNAYYSSVKLNLEDNFSKKAIIVTRAEALAEEINVEWESATAEMMEMTEDWKKIGRVAKEHGDELWERFLKAKRTFFDRKDAEREKRRSEGGKVLDEKVRRNRSYASKLERELELEKEILVDFQDRLKNVAPGVRSFETSERYQSIIDEAQKKVTFLENKIKDVKVNVASDEKDMNYFTRPFKKKEDGAKDGSPRPERTDRPERIKKEFSNHKQENSGMPNLASLVNAALGNKKNDLIADEKPTASAHNKEEVAKVAEAVKETVTAEVMAEPQTEVTPTEAIAEAAPQAITTEPIVVAEPTESVVASSAEPITAIETAEPQADAIVEVTEPAVETPAQDSSEEVATETAEPIVASMTIETPEAAEDIAVQTDSTNAEETA